MIPRLLLCVTFMVISALLLLLAILIARRNRARPEKTTPASLPGTASRVVLFDGVCNLCNSTVRWVIERDRNQKFDFASLQSESAKERLSKHLSTEEIDELPDSIVLIDDQGVHSRSTAILRIAAQLGFPYSLTMIFAILPKPLRDMIYSWIAGNRYRWFGRQDSCMMPTPALASRFLDAQEPRQGTTGTAEPAAAHKGKPESS